MSVPHCPSMLVDASVSWVSCFAGSKIWLLLSSFDFGVGTWSVPAAHYLITFPCPSALYIFLLDPESFQDLEALRPLFLLPSELR